MDLISTLRYEAQRRKEEEERKAKEAEAAAEAEAAVPDAVPDSSAAVEPTDEA
jgi:hypothetical protein